MEWVRGWSGHSEAATVLRSHLEHCRGPPPFATENGNLPYEQVTEMSKWKPISGEYTKAGCTVWKKENLLVAARNSVDSSDWSNCDLKVLHVVVQVEKLVYTQNRSRYFRRAQSPHAFFFRPNCSFTVVMWQYWKGLKYFCYKMSWAEE